MAVLSAKPKKRKTSEGVRSKLYKGLQGELPDLSVLNLSEVYKDFPQDHLPMVCSMVISKDVPQVDSLFGKVQMGSVLSYQQPTKVDTAQYHQAPPPPQLPLDGYSLGPSECLFVCTRKQQLHLQSLEVTWEMSRQIERGTREQSLCADWHTLRRPRLTASRFREICQVGEAFEGLAKRILSGTHQIAAMKRGLEMEADTIWEYCQVKRLNHYKCAPRCTMTWRISR